MAQKVSIVLVDDITGDEIAEGGESISYAVGGVEYTIDLNAKNSKKFHDTMQFYIDHSTKTGGRAKRASGAKRDKSETQAIKAWATEQGIDFPQRGRLPQTLLDQYAAAH